MNFPFLEHFLFNIFLMKAAGDTGLRGGSVWGRHPRLSLPRCTPLLTKALRAAEIVLQTRLNWSRNQMTIFKFRGRYQLYPTRLI